MTPLQYAKQEYAAERFPSLIVIAVHDKFALTDKDFHFLDHDLFDSKDAAIHFRSKVLDKASKAKGRAA